MLLAALTAALAGGTQTASASSSAQANIDWNSLTIQYFDLSGGKNAPTINWTSQYGNAYSYAYTDNPYDWQSDGASQTDFTSMLSTNTSTLKAQSSSLRDTNVLQASASSQPDTGSNYYNNYASAYSYNSGNFDMTGKGLALITLHWSTSANSDNSDWSSYAYAQAYLYGYFDDHNGNSGSATGGNTDYTQYNETGAFSHDGTFSLAIFSDGIHSVTGYLSAQSYTYATSAVSQVPVPTAVWLFGSGLMGMLGVARRRQVSA